MANEIDKVTEMVLWAREQGVLLHEITVGDLTVKFQDLKLEYPHAPEVPGRPTEERPKSFYHAAAINLGLVDEDSTPPEDEDEAVAQ